MPRLEQLLLTYLQLARASERRGQPLVRDKLLLLAGVTALELDWDEISAECRQRILRHNPRHLIRRWPDLASASRTERFRSHQAQLRRKYSPEKAEHMLEELCILPSDGSGAGQSVRDHAAALVDSLDMAAERTAGHAGAAALPAAAQPVPPRGSQTAISSQRMRGLQMPLGSPSARFARWWPFWLGLAAWIVLALLATFSRGGSGWS